MKVTRGVLRELLEMVYGKRQADVIFRELDETWKEYVAFSFRKQRVTKTEFTRRFIKRVLHDDGFVEISRRL